MSGFRFFNLSCWWWAKLCVNTSVLIGFIATGIGGEGLAENHRLLVGQGIVFFGAGIHLWHFCRLRSCAKCLGVPEALVVSGGLFNRIRHPMYLGELLVLWGLCLIAQNIPLRLVFLGSIFVGCRLCCVEDREMAARFEGAFSDWSRKTKRLIPGVW